MPIYIEQPIAVGSTPRFRVYAQLDSATWDLTGGTVELYLGKPDGTVVGPLSVTLTDAEAGEATYTALTTTLDQAGRWWRQRKYDIDGVIEWSQRYEFEVAEVADPD